MAFGLQKLALAGKACSKVMVTGVLLAGTAMALGACSEPYKEKKDWLIDEQVEHMQQTYMTRWHTEYNNKRNYDDQVDSDYVIADADWTDPRQATIVFSGEKASFEPMVTALRRDKPVKLALVNKSELDHAFCARKFFTTVAVKSISQGDVVEEGPFYVRCIPIAPGTTRNVMMIPTISGIYETASFEPLEALGWTGRIQVVD